MAGGLLQLVAKGKEDDIISYSPQITLFKTIYRRHTNFSKTETEMNFNNKLTFGSTANCPLKKLADYVSRLTMLIELPTIDISYLPLTNQQLALMLSEYGITWSYNAKNKDVLITNDEFLQVVGVLTYINGRLTRQTNGMINDQIDYLTRQLEKDDEFIKVINTVTQQYKDSYNTNVDDYIDDLMLELLLANRNLFLDNETYIDEHDYYNQYLYLHSYKKDLRELTPREVSWYDTPRNIISFYDPINGIPSSASANDGYISSSTNRGWIVKIIYRYVNSIWNETSPSIYDGVHLDSGMSNMPSDVFYENTGLSKFALGFFAEIPNGISLPINPQTGDTYICATNVYPYEYTYAHIYQWNGVQWQDITPVYGMAYYIIADGINYSSYFQRYVYFDGTNWQIYNPPSIILYDGTMWRKSVYALYDPSIGLPSIVIPDSLSKIYLSSSTANNWKINYLYIWDGINWIERIPTSGFSVYVEDGSLYSNNILTYDGIIWKLISMPLPLYNFETFRKIVYSELQKIIFTDSNVKLLYGVENCNTIVIPSTSVLPLRTFFDTIVSNEIDTIDTNSAVYKLIYNTYFDTSLVGNTDHITVVQSDLGSAIRTCISDIINPNIEMLSMIYQLLSHIVSSNPDYFQLIYYKPYPLISSVFDTTQSIINCPRDYYHLPYASRTGLWDYFAGYIMHTPSNSLYSTSYTDYIKEQTLLLCGSQIGMTDGSLYAHTQESRMQSMFNNFFTNTDTRYETVLTEIKVDPLSLKIIYNIAQCINLLSTSIKDNLKQDYLHMWTGLEAIMTAEQSIIISLELASYTELIYQNISNVTQEPFGATIWNATNGLNSKINDGDRLATFIFQKYTTYTVIDPVSGRVNPILDQNPIEYLTLTFAESLKAYIDVSKSNWTLTDTQTLLLKQHIDNVAIAYMCIGLNDYTTFSINGTNILEANVPELFYTGVDNIQTYHLPYDGITSMACYLLNQMKNDYNAYYQTVTNQSIYNNIGNPLMIVNAQFISNSDFYVYGNQMYVDGYQLIQLMIDVYKNDLTRYNNYGKILKIKNVYLEPSKYKYTYPIEIYIELQKEIYNNQSIYISSTKTYNDVYTNILALLNNNMLPLLEFFNMSNGVYMGPMDVLIETLTQRLRDLRINPYDAIDDTTRYTWYQTNIISSILDIETGFYPETVSIIEYFLNTINSITNPFNSSLNLYDWYNDIVRDKVSYEIVKMKDLFGIPYYSDNSSNSNAITPTSLYNDLGNINNTYNSFTVMTDFIKYMMDHIIKISTLGNIVPLFKKTIDATSLELLNYYQTEKSNCLSIIDRIHPYTLTSINGSVKYSTLEDIIRNIYNKEQVNFAWIREIGHYLIDSVELLIGDAVIDKYNGEYMHIQASTETTGERLQGYKKMIGDVPELYTYNNKKKYSYKLFIPITFSFSKFYNASLPLFCLQHTDVSIRVKLHQLTDVAYWAPMTKFNKIPQLKCKMIADYIYIDHDERMRIAPLAQDILVDTIQYNGDILVDLSTETEKTIKLCFGGTSKELFIVCQMDEYINGSLLNGEKQWNNYLVSVPKEYKMINGSYETTINNVNPIDSMEIRFNGRQREPLKDILYYNCIQRIVHHTTSLYDGINVYSFSIRPEEQQPSGVANTGKIGYVELYIKFRDDVIALVGKQKKLLRIGIYNKSINFLRVRSGMAGLAFYN